jgi:hypothetical protein
LMTVGTFFLYAYTFYFIGVVFGDWLWNKIQPNKALQLTPSRIAPVSYDRSAFPFTSSLELVRPFGVAELGVRPLWK